jgi:DNA-binding MarR family transcriptional regulator
MQAKSPRKRRNTAKDAGGRTSQIELGWLGGTIGFNLRIAQEASVRAYLRSVTDTETLTWRFAILALIDLNPGLTQAALARAVMRDTSSLTSVLDDLCNRELVTRVRPEHDRRSYALRITPLGIKAMDKLKAKVQAHERELDRFFKREQRSQLIDMLRQIALGLSENKTPSV